MTSAPGELDGVPVDGVCRLGDVGGDGTILRPVESQAAIRREQSATIQRDRYNLLGIRRQSRRHDAVSAWFAFVVGLITQSVSGFHEVGRTIAARPRPSTKLTHVPVLTLQVHRQSPAGVQREARDHSSARDHASARDDSSASRPDSGGRTTNPFKTPAASSRPPPLTGMRTYGLGVASSG